MKVAGRRSPRASRLRLFYFLHYGYVGAFLSFFAPYLRGLGFKGEQIGAVTMAAQLVAAPAALGWGQLADRRGAFGDALRVCGIGALAAVSFLPLARTPLEVGAVLVGQALFAGAIIPLADSVTVEWSRAASGGSYARIRLFGSLGFVVVAQALGLSLSLRGDRPADRLVPLAMVACVAGTALLAQSFGGAVASEQRPSDRGPASSPPRRSSLRAAAASLARPPLLVLLGFSALHWGACGPYHLFFGVLVRDQGFASRITGLATSLGVCAEVVALFLFPALARRISLRALFLAAFVGSTLRWLLLWRADSAFALVALQLLHAFTFGLFWACVIEALGRLVPAALRATGQAIFSALVFGAGNAVGSALSGVGYDHFGSARPLFLAAAGVEGIAVLLMLAASWELREAV